MYSLEALIGILVYIAVIFLIIEIAHLILDWRHRRNVVKRIKSIFPHRKHSHKH